MIKLVNILGEIQIAEEEKAYHGTGHYFKCFRTAGIGGGFGAQAFGWGLYFAKTMDIPKEYMGLGSNGKKIILFQGKTPGELALQYDNIVFEKLPSGLNSIEEFIDYAEDNIEILKDDDEEENAELIREYERFIDIIQHLEMETEDAMYIYEVILHKGKKPGEYEYLDWDLSRTPQNQIDKINKEAEKENLGIIVNNNNMSPRDVYHYIERHFSAMKKANPPKEASLFLLRAGIDGTTLSKGEVRVIFDERAIEIINVCKHKR